MWQKSRPYILILPSLIIICTLFIGGLILGLLQSLGLMDVGGNSYFTINAYKQLILSKDFMDSLALTLKVALVSSILSGILAIIIIRLLFILGENKKTTIFRKLFQVPMLVPHVTAAYLIMLLLMKSGWLSSIAYSVGITKSMDAFPSVVNDSNSLGIILTYIWKETPFIMLMIFPIISRTKDSWLEIAQVFGARRQEFFKEVILPLIIQTWLSSVIIVFAFTFSDFEVPYLLGITYPKFISVYSYNMYYNGQLSDRPLALAANFILAIITAMLGLIAYKLAKQGDTKEARW
ncbi:ABC transporter permease subunit [Clostridium tagluense]|uniref:ABC transporter permease n=1 Tax=Clostridium tagluense TaxID=360422 RepID=UPI001CF3E07B|nr:ABC transporter permease subunit [Clostridium tagluense]MCB2311110.1 ABC transporter permease subunit [Clostridium tagluense]MCB2315834.1 ABC transporter permease subunit [Clostridium tagluense]MCB2320819.1 ABC transporter permease subunit [Clostridium tagluense]MCB2325836.1 ABC transporter permease subunit [Clostridium tagluense]MCB2330426.1 ABC transporter permease subunit [Clostridium tagluense]